MVAMASGFVARLTAWRQLSWLAASCARGSRFWAGGHRRRPSWKLAGIAEEGLDDALSKLLDTVKYFLTDAVRDPVLLGRRRDEGHF